MNLENPIFLCPALCGLIYLGVGYYTTKFPPKKINGLYGYRTPSSMRSQERWDFAQEYSSRQMLKAGILLLLLGFIGSFLEIASPANVGLGIGIMLGVTALMIFSVERKINREFGGK